MKPSERVVVKDVVAQDLALRASADRLFDKINSLRVDTVMVDFSKVRSISRSFAHQYVVRRSESQKKVAEAHVPENVRKMLAVVEEPAPKKRLINLKQIGIIRLREMPSTAP
ncbi:MAG: DUF4325 domain-containing protein [Candidatus Micrarchaeia archaeon]|jgi:hypothetical protein